MDCLFYGQHWQLFFNHSDTGSLRNTEITPVQLSAAIPPQFNFNFKKTLKGF